MQCERWRDAISARADGEAPGIDTRLLDAHVATCPGCRRFRDEIDALRRPLRVGAAPAMPDLSPRIVKLNAIADRARAWGAARVLLAAVAVQIVVLSLPALVLGEDQATTSHDARHLGAFSVADAAGLLVVVVRPARARSILPVAAVLAGALLITAAVDIAQGRAPLVGETVHIPEILSVGLVWLLAAPPRRHGGQVGGRPALPSLHVVDRAEDSHAGRDIG
jgi:predicted anti-sigma-YlaC factor YlaD